MTTLSREWDQQKLPDYGGPYEPLAYARARVLHWTQTRAGGTGWTPGQVSNPEWIEASAELESQGVLERINEGNSYKPVYAFRIRRDFDG